MKPILHHLSDDILSRHAAGTLPEAFGLVVAAHVSMCDDCRARLLTFEALGGALLDQETAPLSEDALEVCFALIGTRTPAPRPAPPRPARGPFPRPLADYVGDDPAAIRWRALGGGIRQAILPTSGPASARLLYIPAGRAVPDHGHGGMEMTLVLQGAFRDADARFGPGDVEIAGQDDGHQPIAEPGEDCICLAATDAPLRFRGLMPRLLQPLFRI